MTRPRSGVCKEFRHRNLRTSTSNWNSIKDLTQEFSLPSVKNVDTGSAVVDVFGYRLQFLGPAPIVSGVYKLRRTPADEGGVDDGSRRERAASAILAP